MAIYQFTHYDAFGGKDIQTFDTLDDIRWEIDRLERCLEDRYSWRISETISQLREFLAGAEVMEEDEE